MWYKKRAKAILVTFFIGVAGIIFYINNVYNNDDIFIDEAILSESDNDDASTYDDASNEKNSKENNSEESNFEENGSEKENSNGETSKLESTIYIHVCGFVKKPGVYELDGGSRVVDAIEAAGGLTDEAAGEMINQAQLLNDGEKVYVPSKEEVTESGITSESTVATDTTASDNGGNDLVNINTASKEELMSIPGIGETRAESIIEYRDTQGKFDTIESIMNVSGIKEGLFNKISEYITI